ncbi:MAG: SprT-like domain-containing protein [Clostridium sp.]|nr:SprT-like domain-containing protein [Clostridium sp.]
MKELIKSSRVTGYLEKMYRELNADKFGGQLEETVITIVNTPRAYGHVTCAKVWKVAKKGEQESRYELNVSSDSMARPIEDVVSTMLHEMVHIYHLMNGIKDVSRGGTYHNKTFKSKAESVGLVIEHSDKYGWTITSPSEKLIVYIISKGWTEIAMNRGGISSFGGTSGGTDSAGKPDGKKIKKPSSTRKYMCPCCSMSVRATREVRIKCADCDVLMTVAE